MNKLQRILYKHDSARRDVLCLKGGDSWDCILKMSASAFLHVKAEVLIYVYICFIQQAKECLPLRPDILHSSNSV